MFGHTEMQESNLHNYAWLFFVDCISWLASNSVKGAESNLHNHTWLFFVDCISRLASNSVKGVSLILCCRLSSTAAAAVRHQSRLVLQFESSSYCYLQDLVDSLCCWEFVTFGRLQHDCQQVVHCDACTCCASWHISISYQEAHQLTNSSCKDNTGMRFLHLCLELSNHTVMFNLLYRNMVSMTASTLPYAYSRFSCKYQIAACWQVRNNL